MKYFRFFILLVLSSFLLGQGSGTAVRCGTDDVFIGYCSPDFGFDKQMTITAWVKWNLDPSTTSSFANIASNNTPDVGDVGQFWLQHNTANSLFQFAVRSDEGRRFVQSSTSPQADTWYHVAGVYDLSAGNNKLMIYVNGVYENSTTGIAGTKITDYVDDYYFKAGKWSMGNSDRAFYGDIDELTIWNTALTVNEIRNMMCQKLVGNEAGLVGYWRFDENEKEMVEDLSPNSNNGNIYRESGKAESSTNTTITDDQKTWTVDEWKDHFIAICSGTGNGQKRTILSNTASTITVSEDWLTNPDNTTQYVVSDHNAWLVSGAPLGDESAYDFSSPVTLSLNSTDGDGIEVSSITNSPTGVQVYRVDDVPNVSTAPGNLNNLSLSHYFGVFTVGGTTSTYTLTYNYDGHPGITNESVLDLATRSNNASTNWTEANATHNTEGNTLVLADQSGTEYILGSELGDNPLPISLLSLTATAKQGNVEIAWSTASETENSHFLVYRDGVVIAQVDGAGTTSESNDYVVVDDAVVPGVHEYALADVSYAGLEKVHETVSVEVGSSVTAASFVLNNAYPNPFNPSVTLSMEYGVGSNSEINIYNTQGSLVETLHNGYLEAGHHEINWDASNMQSGVYIVKMNAGNTVSTQKLVLMK